ncbi:MAG: hypothetical protein PVF58_09405 [Candidatus Methanofastidiosia archaeon]
MVEVRADCSQVSFEDGTTLEDIFASVPDYNTVFIDLRLEENASVRIGRQFFFPRGLSLIQMYQQETCMIA